MFWKISSDANIQSLGDRCTLLNTLYINNIVFIRDHNQTRDGKLMDIYMNKDEKMKGFKDVDDFNRFYAVYDYHTNESHEVLSHFVIVALYSYYERTWKNMLIKNGFCTKEEYKLLYKYDKFKKFFFNKFAFEYEDRNDSDFLLLEEIRCISNCIKHSGFVSTDLNRINSLWNIDEEIKEIPHEYIEKFVNVPFNYAKKIVNKINNLYFEESN